MLYIVDVRKVCGCIVFNIILLYIISYSQDHARKYVYMHLFLLLFRFFLPVYFVTDIAIYNAKSCRIKTFKNTSEINLSESNTKWRLVSQTLYMHCWWWKKSSVGKHRTTVKQRKLVTNLLCASISSKTERTSESHVSFPLQIYHWKS